MKLKDCKSAKDFRACFVAHPVALFMALKAAPSEIVDVYEKEGKPGEGITLRKFTACASGLKLWRDSLPHKSPLREAAAAVEAHLRHSAGLMSFQAALSYAGEARATGAWKLSGSASRKFEPGSAQPRPKAEAAAREFSDIPEALAELARLEEEAAAEAVAKAEAEAAENAAVEAARNASVAAQIERLTRKAINESASAEAAAARAEAPAARAAAEAAAAAAMEAARLLPYTTAEAAPVNAAKAKAAAAAAVDAAAEAAAEAKAKAEAEAAAEAEAKAKAEAAAKAAAEAEAAAAPRKRRK